jgi:hypothetical protein
MKDGFKMLFHVAVQIQLQALYRVIQKSRNP